MRTDGGQAAQILGVPDAALGDQEAVGRHQGGQFLGGREIGGQRAEIAVVDADQRCLQTQSAVEFAFVVDLHQHVHAQIAGQRFQFPRRGVGQAGHDEQDAIGAHGAALEHLPRVEDEILAQHGQSDGGAGGAQMLGGALEERLIGQHRQAGGAAFRIGASQRGRVEIGPDQSAGGRGLLDFRDQSVLAADGGILQRGAETARLIGAMGDGLTQRLDRRFGLAGGEFHARVGADAQQHVGNGGGVVGH